MIPNERVDEIINTLQRNLQVDWYGLQQFLGRKWAKNDYDLKHHGITEQEVRVIYEKMFE